MTNYLQILKKNWTLMEEKYSAGTEVDKTTRLHNVSSFISHL